MGDSRAQLLLSEFGQTISRYDLNTKDLKRWRRIMTPWSQIWTLMILGGRLHFLRRIVSLPLGRWTLWGPVLGGRPDMVRHLTGISTNSGDLKVILNFRSKSHFSPENL